MDKCPTPDSSCPLKKCFGDTHHLYYPARWYRGGIELAFRNLEENKEFLCRREHNERHATEEPPEKPTREFMLNAIQRARRQNGQA